LLAFLPVGPSIVLILVLEFAAAYAAARKRPV